MENYRKIEIVGKGSFGCAVLVQSVVDRKYYIMKIIDVSKMDRKQKEEALNEVTFLKAMRHPFIITYRESFMDKNRYLCIVMDYAEGGDMYTKIAKQKKLGKGFPEIQILDWFVQICLALKYVHGKKILHRDLKTQNIFLTGKGEIKIGDFGIARVLQNTYDCAQTAIGTPYYLSPEICQEKPYNQKSDIWSLGCILYELVTLRHAFDANSMKGLVLKILRGQYPAIPNTYSPELKDLISEMLTREPKNRPSIKKLLEKDFLAQRIGPLLTNTLAKHDLGNTILKKVNAYNQGQDFPANQLAANVSVSSSNTQNTQITLMSNASEPHLQPIANRENNFLTDRTFQNNVQTNKSSIQQASDVKKPLRSDSKESLSKSYLQDEEKKGDKSQQSIGQYGQMSVNNSFQQQQQSLIKKNSATKDVNQSRVEDSNTIEPNAASQLDKRRSSSVNASQNKSTIEAKRNEHPSTSNLNKSVLQSEEEQKTLDANNKLKSASNVRDNRLQLLSQNQKENKPTNLPSNASQNTSSTTIAVKENEEKLQNLINSVKDYLYPEKNAKSAMGNKIDSEDEDDENFQEDDDKRVFAKFLTVEGKEIPGCSEKDSISYRIEALRVYLENNLTPDVFYACYKYLMNQNSNEDEQNRELLKLVGGKNERFLPMVYQMIVCEEQYYGNANK
jgi:NIMA (never in mitosis gene a)-related kinase